MHLKFVIGTLRVKFFISKPCTEWPHPTEGYPPLPLARYHLLRQDSDRTLIGLFCFSVHNERQLKTFPRICLSTEVMLEHTAGYLWDLLSAQFLGQTAGVWYCVPNRPTSDCVCIGGGGVPHSDFDIYWLWITIKDVSRVLIFVATRSLTLSN